MPDGMDQFLWFVAGVFSYRIVSSILNYGHMHAFMVSLKSEILMLLFILEEDTEKIVQLKYDNLRSTGSSKDEVEKINERDKQTLNIWKEVIISRLRSCWPKYYRDLIKFDNWKEAKREFKEQHKKNS
tara:strand:- start:60 stop:443 length:384 start_codon:yes stop_codon:yes gene_type:complete